jgi:type II secretion system protein I
MLREMKFLEISQRGFTLLEVLIAMAIMSVSIGAILMLEGNNRDAMTRAEQMNIVAMLAKNKMVETELELEGASFEELSGESSGSFQAPYEEYRWTRKIEEVEFPNLMEMAGQGEDGRVSQAEAMMGQLITKFLSNALREIAITVTYPRGSGEQDFVVSTYWVDLNHELSLSP